jgi:hypothetical protein
MHDDLGLCACCMFLIIAQLDFLRLERCTAGQYEFHDRYLDNYVHLKKLLAHQQEDVGTSIMESIGKLPTQSLKRTIYKLHNS